jgi:hypothetical protein
LSIVYLVALAAFCVVFLGVLYEAVVSVSRKPVWHSHMPRLALVDTEDRRRQQVPFVGQDRRLPGADVVAAQGGFEEQPRQVA